MESLVVPVWLFFVFAAAYITYKEYSKYRRAQASRDTYQMLYATALAGVNFLINYGEHVRVNHVAAQLNNIENQVRGLQMNAMEQEAQMPIRACPRHPFGCPHRDNVPAEFNLNDVLAPYSQDPPVCKNRRRNRPRRPRRVHVDKVTVPNEEQAPSTTSDVSPASEHIGEVVIHDPTFQFKKAD
jgi:hypothetical protein